MKFVAVAKALEQEAGFTGGPPQLFEKVGRDSFVTAVMLGLTPDHKFLDFGAGWLRLGYWFVRFLDAGNYYAIEPREAALEIGKKHLLGPDILREKAPNFYVSNKCDISTLGVPFDFVIARSIFTHTKPGMLHRILEEFAKSSAPDGVLLASYWAASGENVCNLQGHMGDDMGREDWGYVGVIKYSRAYLESAARERGLVAQEFTLFPRLNQQTWITFRHVQHAGEIPESRPSEPTNHAIPRETRAEPRQGKFARWRNRMVRRSSS